MSEGNSFLRERQFSSVALGLVILLLAYEWFASSLTKLVHGDFPAGLGADLRQRASGTYGTFLRHVVIPHASVFGWAIQLTELLVALLLAVGALSLLSGRRRALGLVLVGVGALVGAVLTINFALSSGENFFVLVASDSFDEGMPLDVLATWLQLILVAGLVFTVLFPPRAERAA